MAKYFKKAAEAQRKRILEKLDTVEPGTKEYRELQNQLGAFDIMEEKQSSGNVKPSDWLKFGGTLISTGLIVTADHWIPTLGSKLRLSEFVGKIFR